MRRTGNATHSNTTTSVASALSKVDINYTGPQFKSIASTGITPTAVLSSAQKKFGSLSTAAYGQNKLTTRNPINPLVHRSTQSQHLNSSTNNSQPPSPPQTAKKNSYKNNNNGSNNSLNNITNSSGNNNMQTPIDQEDIKFIDSDEQLVFSTTANERKSQQQPMGHNDQRYFSNSHAHNMHNSIAKTRVRPKSTIICSSSTAGNSAGSNLIFEKVNHYKYSNGLVGLSTGKPSPAATIEKGSETAIDSNSIRASIEKFNSFSEQKRLPLSSVNLRSSGGSGSTSNLQHHRHSSDLDNCNLRLTSSGGGSLTRTPYRSSGGGSKVITSLHLNASAAVSSASARHAQNASQISTGSLPLKANKHLTHVEDSSNPCLSGSVDGDVGKKKLISISGGQSDRRAANASIVKTVDESVSAPMELPATR